MKSHTYNALAKKAGLENSFLAWLIHDAPDDLLALLRVLSVSRKKRLAMVVFEGTTRFVPAELADRIEAARVSLAQPIS